MKKLVCAESAGFCYGVRRAVQIAEAAADREKPCVMLGPVIHNRRMIERLRDLGVDCVERMGEIPPGAAVIIRSHGEGFSVHDRLARQGTEVIDATCPNVTRIHRLVSDARERGRRTVIIGARNHPEVLAIAAWCENPLLFEGAEELSEWLAADPQNRTIPLTMVSQTTATQQLWKACTEKVKKECTNCEIFDTICNATLQRQEEAAALAARCDAVVVVGDPKSANTAKLTEICRRICPTVCQIEQAGELEVCLLRDKDVVGITAGASTPRWIIKEVYNRMDEVIRTGVDAAQQAEEAAEKSIAGAAPAAAPAPEETPDAVPVTEETTDAAPASKDAAEADPDADGSGEESFAEMLEKSLITLNTGEKVTGVVTAITPTEIYVDLGAKHAGYIPVSELTDDPEADINDIVKVGDSVETYIMRVNDVEGVVTLSKKRLDTVKSWDDIEAAREAQTVVEGIVTEENKGGVVVSVRGVRVFVPASRTGIPKDEPMSALLKTKVRLRITEVNRARRRVVGSIRAVQYEERRAAAEQVWNEIEAGKRYSGVVKSLTSYGAFVDIGGVDGMVHVSELTWGRIKHPSEVINVGDQVDVTVLSFDSQKKKISLGMKDRTQDPWNVFMETCPVGSVVQAKIVKLMTFGAFAEVIPGVDGLIHISQIADRRIDKPGDVLSEGQMVDVKITEVNTQTHKISLSIRALLEEARAAAEEVQAERALEPDEIVATAAPDTAPQVAPGADETGDE